MAQEISFILAFKEYFEIKNLVDLAREVNKLSLPDKQEIAKMLSKEFGKPVRIPVE